MISAYIHSGDIFILYEHKKIIAECVVVKISQKACELKNIAVAPEYQKMGYGKKLLEYIINFYSAEFSYMLVGTSKKGIDFYKKFDFVLFSKKENFFANNYTEPVYEDGELCRHMYMLKKKLSL